MCPCDCDGPVENNLHVMLDYNADRHSTLKPLLDARSGHGATNIGGTFYTINLYLHFNIFIIT